MKLFTIAILLALSVGCKENNRIINLKNGSYITLDDRYKEATGFDKIQIVTFMEDTIVSFSQPNEYRHGIRVDTVYTGDTAYKTTGVSIQLANDLYLYKPGSGLFTMKNGMFYGVNKYGKYCDSVTINNYRVIVQVVDTSIISKDSIKGGAYFGGVPRARHSGIKPLNNKK